MAQEVLKNYDVVIIGGGINGAGLFRDLSLNGVSTLLLDKADFSSQTSQGSSKMLHGGIRYLETMDFALVAEALEEKNLWLKLAPHVCQEVEFHMPAYQESKYNLPMLRVGLFLYDFLSRFQNKPHGHTTKEETLKRFPEIRNEGLAGAGTYYDGIVDDAKLALECIYDGLIEKNSQALNYHEVIKVDSTKNAHQVEFQNLMTGEKRNVSARFIIFATGPFTDKLLPQLGIPWEKKMAPSKGIHLWLKKDALNLHGPLVLQTKDNRVIFVIPQRDAILVGTTESQTQSDFFNIKATEDEVTYLLGVLKQYFPKAKLEKASIISSFAAIRPLVSEGGGANLGKISRTHKIFMPQENCYVLLGGKYTTFRRMAQDLCKQLVPRLGKSYNANLTLNPLRKTSTVATFTQRQINAENITKIIKDEKVQTLEDLIKRRLSFTEDVQNIESLAGKNLSEWQELIKQN